MLKNEYFVFTGTLRTMTRKQAQYIIMGLKGHNQSNLTKKTTRLITGYFPIDLIKGYHPSRKLTEAEQAIRSGQSIIIMSEKEFIEFLSQTFQLLSIGL
ncbi:BRCT domain-containing protein [Lactococcus petauri]|uniref:BRCT domain-containing protein n=1 Tax=Lactococcus petauri TaxID=1940789 RepID=UPI0038551210